MNEMIGQYRMVGEFSQKGAGMSRWGVAEKRGEKYFIKEFLTPKYVEDGALPPEMLKPIHLECETFYRNRKAFYDTLRNCKTGNNVITKDFFRFGTRYYITTELVPAVSMTPRQISQLAEKVKVSLLKSTLNSISALHANGLVHSDLKLDNILLKKTSDKFYAAKIIDFDSGFFQNAPPKSDEELVGDAVYFSPEAIRQMFGEDVVLTEKLDIFALGIVFHQFWCGELPKFSKAFSSAAQAVLNDAEVTLDRNIPPYISDLIRRMLSKEPEDRPSAEEAFKYLCGEKPTPEPTPEPTPSIWIVPEL